MYPSCFMALLWTCLFLAHCIKEGLWQLTNLSVCLCPSCKGCWVCSDPQLLVHCERLILLISPKTFNIRTTTRLGRWDSSDDGQMKRLAKATGPRDRGEVGDPVSVVVACGPDVFQYQMVTVVHNPLPWERPEPPPLPESASLGSCHFCELPTSCQ